MASSTSICIPGILRTEGYIGSMKVSEDVLCSDHKADHLTVTVDRETLPADRHSVAMIDLVIDDKHGRRFMLEDKRGTVSAEGALPAGLPPVEIRIDNGNAWDIAPFIRRECGTFNGHPLAKVGNMPGQLTLKINTEGFPMHEVVLNLV